MKRVREEEIFPRNPNKTYGLMELVKGSSTRVDRGPDDMVSSWPHLLIREAALFAFCFAAILLLAIQLPPPLELQANPLKPPNPAKAPWYFLGLQELVAYDAFWGGLGIPGLVVIGLMAIPYLDRHHSGIGRWFAKSRNDSVRVVDGLRGRGHRINSYRHILSRPKLGVVQLGHDAS